MKIFISSAIIECIQSVKTKFVQRNGQLYFLKPESQMLFKKRPVVLHVTEFIAKLTGDSGNEQMTRFNTILDSQVVKLISFYLFIYLLFVFIGMHL